MECVYYLIGEIEESMGGEREVEVKKEVTGEQREKLEEIMTDGKENSSK